MSANTTKAVPDATTGQTMEDHSQEAATCPFTSGQLRNIGAYGRRPARSATVDANIATSAVMIPVIAMRVSKRSKQRKPSGGKIAQSGVVAIPCRYPRAAYCNHHDRTTA